jgi:hypothetical protein
MLVSILSPWPAAAGNPLPLGKNWFPADTKPLTPRPFGISLVSMHVGETLDVSDLGLTLFGQKLPPGAVTLPPLTHTTHITGVTGDAWLLPFLDVHGTIGHVSGTANEIKPVMMAGLLPPGVVIPPSQAFSGTTYASGLTLAIGYRVMFATYDFTYSWTSVDVLDDTVKSTAQRIQAGVRTNLGKVRTAIYVGAFNENIHGPLTGTGLIPALNPDFSLTVTPQGPWDALLGANFEFTSRFVVTTEVGLGNRKQFLIAPGVRF